MKRIISIAIVLLFSAASLLADGDIRIGQNYPNPAKEKTFIKAEFDSPEATLILSNILGETIKVLKLNNSGTYEIDVTEIPDGVYFYTLDAGGQKVTKRLTVKKVIFL